VIDSTSDIVVNYKYDPFGSGDKRLFGALGFTYDTGPFRVKNLSAYRTGIPGQEAPEAGTELPGSSGTQPSSDSISTKATTRGACTALSPASSRFRSQTETPTGARSSPTWRRTSPFFELGMSDKNWVLATISSILPVAGATLSSRGSLLYKNYWGKTTFEGDVLQTLAYSDPKAFAYSEKAGPYNVSDELVR